MSDIKKQLKTLQLGDWSSFVEDVNYNFSVLLSSPLFVGTEGLPGLPGGPGSIGLRGSRWYYIDLDKFREAFPNDNIIGEYQINVDYLNNKLVNVDNRRKLLSECFGTDMFVTGDIIISNGIMLMVDLSIERSIINTGNSINSSYELIEEDILKSVSKYIDDRIKELGTSIELSYNTLYETHAKNFSDSSGRPNNKLEPYSIYDILTTDSVIGTKVPTHKILAPREEYLSEDMSMTQLFGSAKKYHKLIQRTISWDENQNHNTTSEFGPSRKSNPVAVFLQNDYNNGIMIGHPDEDNFTQFGRMYMAITNSKKNLTITGPNTSNRSIAYSHIKIYHDQIDITSKNINFKGSVVANGDIRMLTNTTFTHPSIEWNDSQIRIGSLLGSGTKTEFLSHTHTFEHTKYLNSDFLSIVNKVLTPNKYTFSSNADYTKIPNTANVVANTLLIRNMWNDISNELANLGTKVNNVSNAITLEIQNRIAGDNAINTRITNLIDGSNRTMASLETYLVNLVTTTDTDRKQYIDDNIASVQSDYNSKINSVRSYAENVNSTLATKINSNAQNITAEITDRTNADNAIRGGYSGSMKDLDRTYGNHITTIYDLIDNITGGSYGNLQKVIDDLAAEITNRTNADTAIRGGYSGSMQNLNDRITSVDNAWLAADNVIRGGYEGSMQDLNGRITSVDDAWRDGDNAIRGGYKGSMQDLDRTYGNHITTIYDLIDDITGGSYGNLQKVIDDLAAEIRNRTAADTAIRGGYTGSMQNLNDRITSVDNAWLAADNVIRGGYSGSMQNLNDRITSVDNAWRDGDDSIRGGYSGSMQNISSRIDAETNNRTAADTAIRGGYSGSMQNLYDLINGPKTGGLMPGMIIDFYATSGTMNVSQLISHLFDSNGRGKASVTYSTPMGLVTNANLRHLYICDGRGGRPSLYNKVTRMGMTDLVGNTYGRGDRVTLKAENVPTFTINIPEKTFSGTTAMHNHILDGRRNANVSYAGYHRHDFDVIGDGYLTSTETYGQTGLAGPQSTNSDGNFVPGFSEGNGYFKFNKSPFRQVPAHAGMRRSGEHTHEISGATQNAAADVTVTQESYNISVANWSTHALEITPYYLSCLKVMVGI